MKAVIQRALEATVTVEEKVIGEIDNGFVVLVGFTDSDTEKDIHAMVQKLVHLRIFEDEAGKMNRSLKDANGSILSISQFTLYGNVQKGRRPSFVHAAHPDKAIELYEAFNQALREESVPVETGEFGAMMNVQLTNQGPVTLTIETESGKIIS
ncbi:MAG TPA: D-aminoacyl-tRNA deacylase [Pseudogracilibacillus sp.]|nr:D-aminoacyl-tRNA deacylase [Pseudogracilibacillus sp.]